MSSKGHSEEKPKIGTGHAEAMGRLGLAELRSAFYPNSNIAQPAEYGLYGTALPSEVAEQRNADTPDRADQHPVTMDERLQRAEHKLEVARDGRERDGPEPEKE